MAINDQLKKLYKTITGNDSEGMTIDEIISELADDYPEGGGGGGGTGGDNVYVVPVVENEGQVSFASDVDPEDVFTAFKQNKIVVGKYSGMENQNENVGQAILMVAGRLTGDQGNDFVIDGVWHMFVFLAFEGKGDTVSKIGVIYENGEFMMSDELAPAFVPKPDGPNKALMTDNGGQIFWGTLSGTPLIVHGTLGGQNNDEITINDATLADIHTAAENDKMVLLVVPVQYTDGDNSESAIIVSNLRIADKTIESGVTSYRCVFYAVDVRDNDQLVETVVFSNSLTGTVQSFDLPPYSASEAGYVLKVNSTGQWLEWVAP